jgi:hypothetical protein
MAIPCEVCGKPVHEQVVVCPHCGNDTGVPADPIAELEIAALPELAAAEPADEQGPRDPHGALGRLADGVAKVVSSTAHLVIGDDADDGSLPRAIAREKPRHDTKTKTAAAHRKSSGKG